MRLRLVILLSALAAVATVSASLVTISAWGHGEFGRYAQGTGGAGGTFQSGFNHRHKNYAYHESGYAWHVWYLTTDNQVTCQDFGTANPTHCDNEIGYARSKCHNYEDHGPVQWTCMTTGADTW